jgi:class 3 adenylate cyclase
MVPWAVAEAGSLELAARPMGITELLRAHPWPREYAHARRLEWLWTIDVPAPPDRLWPVVADLSRFNRALGLPPMQFVEKDGLRWGRARYNGIPHEWVEVPWNWVAGRWYELVRLYKKGGMRALYGVYVLEPLGAGTRLHVYYGVVPRSRIFDLALRLSFSSMGRAYRRMVPKLAEEAMRTPERLPDALRAPPPALRREAEERLAQLSATLLQEGLDETAVRQLVEHVRTADDADIERIRVRERARAWGLDEDDLLRVCLHATRAGLLELSWDVVCPHCRGVRDSTATLGNLPTRGVCAACGIDFGTDSAEAVEIAFHAHSSIREVGKVAFCSAEPTHKQHIHVQHAVAPGERADVTLPDAPGRYRVRLKGEMRYGWITVEKGAPDTIEWRTTAADDEKAAPAGGATFDGKTASAGGATFDGKTASAGGATFDGKAAPGATLTLVNDASEKRTFVVETAAWLDLALRPGRLLSFQDFRDLFSEEYLGADVQLAVGEQTILFTDVVGSTAMYAERGDPAAFVEVKRHFDDVFRIIGEHRGAVVKTIGDAAMGAFNDPLDAVRAAHAIHAAFPPGRGEAAIRLRISLNTGPCIAVRLNANIDYFGHAVNLAAKLQAAAEEWQIAMSESTVRAPGVREYLAAQGATLDRLTVPVKGVQEPIAVERWTVYAGQPSAAASAGQPSGQPSHASARQQQR